MNAASVTMSLLQSIPGYSLAASYIKRSYQNDPFRIALELFLLFFALRYLSMWRYQLNNDSIRLTEKEVDDLVGEWVPEPLIQKGPIRAEQVQEASSPLQCWSLTDFLGLHSSHDLKQTAISAVRQYGVGTCGPSGFYGTLDVHLELERQIAHVLGVEAAIIYAQGFSAVSSVIPAFSKRGDVLVADENVNMAIQKGLQLSRSRVYYFQHNNMDDLERTLVKIGAEDKKEGRGLTRRFIVVEGLYAKCGDYPDLPRLLQLRDRYKYRLIVDDSLGIGVLGPRGLGLADQFGTEHSRIDIIVASMSNALGCAGGFCAGAEPIVDHQRLNSQAYCFSASLPALFAKSAMAAFGLVTPERVAKLHQNIFLFRSLYAPKGFNLVGARDSPLLFLRLNGDRGPAALAHMVQELKRHGILVSMASSVDAEEEMPASIRLCISANFTSKDIENMAEALLNIGEKSLRTFLLK